MKKKINIVYSSHFDDVEIEKFNKHVSNTIGVKHNIFVYKNLNQYSLSEVYNRAIDEHHEDDGIIAFIHHDIIFKTNGWGKILLKQFNNLDYQIIGVAGTTNMPITGRWWDDRSKMVGIVEHTNGVREWVSEYCKPFHGVRDVCLIDGLFMAVDTNDIEHRFDEEFKGFHFYDVNFSLDNWLEGVNIGVTTDIRILHKSIGMTNEQWELNRQQFINKYKDELPIV